MEDVVHGVFLLLGLVTVGCVLLITVYLILSGLPAITKIGLGKLPVRHGMVLDGLRSENMAFSPLSSPAYTARAVQFCSACRSGS